MPPRSGVLLTLSGGFYLTILGRYVADFLTAPAIPGVRKRIPDKEMKMKQLNAVLLSSFFGTGLLVAQSLPVKVEIPFDFHACDRVMPAGEYRIDGRNGILSLHEEGRHPRSCFALTQAFVSPHGPRIASVTFRRYGTDYYLRRVWNGVTETGQEVLVSPAEKEQIARSKAKDASETTVLASAAK
jgi:hypothetical protein